MLAWRCEKTGSKSRKDHEIKTVICCHFLLTHTLTLAKPRAKHLLNVEQEATYDLHANVRVTPNVLPDEISVRC